MEMNVSGGYINALDVDFFLFLFSSPPRLYHLHHYLIFIDLIPTIITPASLSAVRTAPSITVHLLPISISSPQHQRLGDDFLIDIINR
jgi:hypothetical protein